MSRVTEITVGFARTINLGSYESAQVKASVTMQLDDEEELDVVRHEIQGELRALIEETWKAQHKPKVKED
jgi:hypothetical protein